MDIKRLQDIGLTPQQISVYLKLLEYGPCTIGILIKHVDIARISCYDTLNRLISKGFIIHSTINKRRVYAAVDPIKIVEYAKEQEGKAEQHRKVIEELLPELNKIKSVQKNNYHHAATYQTREGIKSLFSLMLTTKKTIYVISATGRALEELKYYFPNWHKRREELHLKTFVIFNNELRKNTIINTPLSDIRFMPKEYSSPATTFIFGNYVATLHWSDLPFAVAIESEEIAKSYHNYFKMLWKHAK